MAWDDDDIGISAGQCPLRSKTARARVEGHIARTMPSLKRLLRDAWTYHPEIDYEDPRIQDWILEDIRRRLFKGI